MISSKTALIISFICMSFVCSCSTRQKPIARDSPAPVWPIELPPEMNAHESFRRGFPLALTVHFENGGEALLLMDTGCGRTTLDSSFEPSLGPCLGREWVAALEGGTKKAKVFAAPKLYLGNAKLMTDATILTGKAVGPHDCPYKGILGMDCLSHYCVQVDFAAGQLRFLDPLDPTHENLGTAFPIFPMNARSRVPLIDMNLSNARKFRFMVDSGFWNLVDLTLTPAAMSQVSQNEGVAATSVFVGFRVFSCDNLTLGENKYKDLLIGEVPIEGAQFNGFLGLRFLARHLVTFDFPNRVLYLKPKVPGIEIEH